MKRVDARALLVLAAAACARTEPPPPSPIQSVTVAPHGTGSPNEPVLVVGDGASHPSPFDGPAGFERVRVEPEEPNADFRPPRDRCPSGITELMAVHVPLGDAMELAAGAFPVHALGGTPDAVDVLFDAKTRVVRVVAKKFGLVYVVVERDGSCTLYAVKSGY